MVARPVRSNIRLSREKLPLASAVAAAFWSAAASAVKADELLRNGGKSAQDTAMSMGSPGRNPPPLMMTVLLTKVKLMIRLLIVTLTVTLVGAEGGLTSVVADATPPMTNRLTIVSATPVTILRNIGMAHPLGVSPLAPAGDHPIARSL